MARRKEQKLTAFSSFFLPDGTKVRTDEAPPELWAAKREELAERARREFPKIFEKDAKLMQAIYEHPEEFGATILD